ncbi:hypothetical protein Bhyg_02192 [Pseudolycoriella hygida]|uniref:Uncharacterized protein n=1 Tax=Pseudolycoriella hygida TaxID=35572 RepID=A0A9Q0S8B5_9DIPT|nr:hypothetical protein Bhyg_02192 [Pseudolycoriella hygida]
MAAKMQIGHKKSETIEIYKLTYIDLKIIALQCMLECCMSWADENGPLPVSTTYHNIMLYKH